MTFVYYWNVHMGVYLMDLLPGIILQSGYVSEHQNPVPQHYRLWLSIFGLKVEDAFGSFDEVKTKIK